MSETALAQRNVLAEIAEERAAQDIKWGEQNHRDGITMYGVRVQRGAYNIEPAEWLRRRRECASERGEVSWAAMLLEEVAEAMDEAAAGKVPELRAELVQVAAVAVAWIEAIDRRGGQCASPGQKRGHNVVIGTGSGWVWQMPLHENLPTGWPDSNA